MERAVELGSAVDDKGTTLRAQLEGLREAHGIKDPLLEPIVVHRSVRWIYETFWQLSGQRDYGEMSGVPKRLTFTEIHAYAQEGRYRFSRFDMEALLAMDEAFVSAALKIKRGA